MNFKIDQSWTLFLDRDGVINEKKERDYVKNWSEFSFINGSLEAISYLTKVFGRIFIVTNQRGVGIGRMKEDDLIYIHQQMLDKIRLKSGRIDKVYYCTEVSEFACCRKPNVGMGMKALADFPEIDFKKSIMVGDSISDMIFGNNLGMKKILIGIYDVELEMDLDGRFTSLHEFSARLNNLIL